MSSNSYVRPRFMDRDAADMGCEPIGNDGLVGQVKFGIVRLRGPCGGEHSLSLENAEALRDWLSRKLRERGRRCHV